MLLRCAYHPHQVAFASAQTHSNPGGSEYFAGCSLLIRRGKIQRCNNTCQGGITAIRQPSDHQERAQPAGPHLQSQHLGKGVCRTPDLKRMEKKMYPWIVLCRPASFVTNSTSYSRRTFSTESFSHSVPPSHEWGFSQTLHAALCFHVKMGYRELLKVH